MSLKKCGIAVLAVLLVSSTLMASEVQLTALLIPSGKSFDINFNRTSRAPSRAVMSASIKMEKAQASIDLHFEKMEPAVLFAGNISTYVLWAVGIDGSADNMGEVFVDRKDCSSTQPFFTTKKIFALMVTAEPYVAADLPSEVILFTSGDIRMEQVKTTPFTFTNFSPEAKPALDSISGFQYSDDIPVAFKQAQRVVDTAEKMNAAQVNAEAMRSAKVTLADADNSVRAGADKRQIIDNSRVAIQMATQAIRDTIRTNKAKAAAEGEAKRQAEKAALEARAQAAETEAERTARELKEVEAEREALAQQSKDLAAQRDVFAAERDKVAAERDKVAAERDAVAAEREAIKKERDEMAGTLKNALSTVAETNETARGVIVSLPGILFELNKANLQIPAQLTVAKLAGILMVFQNMNISIEGYTDSTGSDELNMALSTARAKAVYDFLKAQGIFESRMKYQGFGPANPVAPNDSEVDRAKNRRVEVVLTQAPQK